MTSVIAGKLVATENRTRRMGVSPHRVWAGA